MKQFRVRDLKRPVGESITLFTPEPNGGIYVEKDVEYFLRKYGYGDKSGIADRLNFGGSHKCNVPHSLTKLTLKLVGWDSKAAVVSSPSGGIHLVDGADRIAASWSFASLITHWKRKHAQAVYVPSIRRMPPRQYRYGATVLACIGTDFPLVLAAIEKGAVVYDPGIKMEDASTQPKIKRRNQFRIRFNNINSLYRRTEWWKLI